METKQGNSYQIERTETGIVIKIEGLLPAATVNENPKFPWSNWQVKYQSEAVSKAVDNLLLAVANMDHVSDTVNARKDSKEETKTASRLEKLRAQIADLEAQQAAQTNE